MMHRKTQLAAAVGVALLGLGSTAVAQTPPTVQVYGQVSRTLLHADDGTQSKWFHTDNEASGTRLGVTGTGQAIPGLRAGFRWEMDFQSNESQRVNFGAAGPVSNFPGHVDGAGFAERHMDAWLEGGWGRLNIGQGDGAANGASESDLSGTGMANGIGVADIGGGFAYRTPGGGFGPAVTATINQQDFESRYDRLMYTTPTMGGARIQLSHGQNVNTDIKELALFYGAKLGGLGELAAALGYSNQGGTGPGLTKDVTIGGSASWLHTSGFNLTASYTSRDNPTATAGDPVRNSKFKYLKAGFKFGPHAIAADYAMGDDFAATGDEAKMWGVGYVWNPLRFLELYAAYKIHSLDRSAGSFEDVKIAHVGTRVRF
jgi:predicted porin